ncbi:hypothetical protein [Streptomyces purpureus]|uniref:Secreted protein n=1 Tax=Streptomyces purpureus TaxID=1951 RepID=A0A918H4D3_9ACTN|nr:hypothetical protein [Streptomyces purpureus]GGT36484.1 hypothetical protein GCM10014713_32740 [Streptomyces purpureus]
MLGAAALTALTTVTAPSASAAVAPPGGSSWDHTWSGDGVKVYVKEHGDVISVCDTSANGHSAWVLVMDISVDKTAYELKATGGKGTCASHTASEGGRYNLAENHRIALNFEGRGLQGSYYVSFVNDH